MSRQVIQNIVNLFRSGSVNNIPCSNIVYQPDNEKTVCLVYNMYHARLDWYQTQFYRVVTTIAYHYPSKNIQVIDNDCKTLKAHMKIDNINVLITAEIQDQYLNIHVDAA